MSDADQLDSKHRVAETEEEIDRRADGESCRGGDSGRRRRGKNSSSLDRRFHSLNSCVFTVEKQNDYKTIKAKQKRKKTLPNLNK